MQNIKKITTLFITSIVLSLIVVTARFLLINNSFDFETKFFNNTTLAVIISVFAVFSAVILFVMSKKTKFVISDKSIATTLLNSCAAIVFILIFIATYTAKHTMPLNGIERVTRIISLITSILSVAYYGASVVSSFLKKPLSNTVLRLLNLSPVIYFASELISTFSKVSGQANSLYHFPHIISILVLAFFILSYSKSKINGLVNNNISLTGYVLAAIIIFPFSALPDLVFHFNGAIPLTKAELILSILKVLYFAFICATTIKFITTKEEQ